MERKIPLKFKNSDGTIITLPDDTRQLVGYDCDGDEIYEGDRLYWEFEVRPKKYPQYKILYPLGDGNPAMLLPCTAYGDGAFNKELWELILARKVNENGKIYRRPHTAKV